MAVLTPTTPQELEISRKLEPYLNLSNPANINAKYNYLAKINENKTVGVGIHETKAYDCLVSKAELAKKRAEFWETRTEGSLLVWKALRYAVENSDLESISACLQAQRIKLIKGTLQLCFDDKKHRFVLPVWIINEPDSYPSENLHQAIQAQAVDLTVHYNGKGTAIRADLKDPFEQLREKVKEIIKSTDGFDPEKEKLRVVYRGKVLEEGHLIGEYVKGGETLQVFKIQKI